MNCPAIPRLGAVVLLLLAAPAARGQDLDPAPGAWADGKQVNAVLWNELQGMPPIEALAAAPGDELRAHPYEAGTWGPEAADQLIERDGRRWRKL